MNKNNEPRFPGWLLNCIYIAGPACLLLAVCFAPFTESINRYFLAPLAILSIQSLNKMG